MPPDFLTDMAFRVTLGTELGWYLAGNWGSMETRAMDWEALKVIFRGTWFEMQCGVWQQIDVDIKGQEQSLAQLNKDEAGSATTRREVLRTQLDLQKLWESPDKHTLTSYH
ncbi:hypothetical protein NDU88_005073 [Pleurodeles waltl]|uniref:Uncharacterized protein n=1 Tax=Pleurodeles waltl TaxID=8319 RepID=A0AAV7X042_PLEWA|nr:hypothetical protein NDU88_005073 [Pleurodeles waltl]